MSSLLSACLCACLYVRLHVCAPACLRACACLSAWLHVWAPACLYDWMSVRLLVRTIACLYIGVSHNIAFITLQIFIMFVNLQFLATSFCHFSFKAQMVIFFATEIISLDFLPWWNFFHDLIFFKLITPYIRLSFFYKCSRTLTSR